MLVNQSYKPFENEVSAEEVGLQEGATTKNGLYRGLDNFMAMTFSFTYIGSIPSLIAYINYGLGR